MYEALLALDGARLVPYSDSRASQLSGFVPMWLVARGCGELWVTLSPVAGGNTLQGRLSLE